MLKSLFLIIMAFPILLFAEGGSNDPQVTITPSSISITEGDSGVKTLRFTISVDKCPDLMPIKIKYTTTNGTASSDSDYVPTSGTIEFNTPFFVMPCQMTHTIEVEVKGDEEVEPDENFYIQLSDNGTNSYQSYHWGNQRATINIENDDTPPPNVEADLEVTKTNNISPNKAEVGDIVTYTLNAKNNGPNASKVLLYDKLPKYVDFVSVSDNRSNFDCSYNSSTRYIRCYGAKNFNKDETLKVTIKAKVNTTKRETITNSATIKSYNGIEDPDTSNNRSTTKFKVKRLDIKGKKYIRNSEGKYIDRRVSVEANSTVRFKIRINNNKEHPTKINLYDIMPSTIKISNVFIEGNPSDYHCTTYVHSSGNDAIECSGDKIFNPDDYLNIFIDAVTTMPGRYINTIWVDSDNPDVYYDYKKSNNYETAIVDVGIDYRDERVEEFSKEIVSPIKSEYEVGDIVTFKIKAKTTGITQRVRIRDFEQKYGTTRGAFEFLEVNSLNSNLDCTLKGVNLNREAFCESPTPLVAGSNLEIEIKAKLKKDGDNICNGAHYYKEYIYSFGMGFKWLKYTEKCLKVNKAKVAPILDADIFYVQINVPDSIDLKYYTTDEDTPKDKLTYTIVNGSLPDGYSMSSDGTISGNYTDANGSFPKEFNVTVKVTDDTNLSSTDSFTIVVKADEIKANDNYYEIPINQQLNGNLITDSQSTGPYTFEADKGVDLVVTNVLPTDSKLSWQSNGSFTFRAPNSVGEYQYTYYIKDKYSQEDSATLYIKVYQPIIKANDDTFKVPKNTTLRDNVFADHGLGVDVGDDIKVIKHTLPSHGVLNIKEDGSFAYTPNLDYKGSDSFTYTIEDKYGQKDSATVLLVVGELFIEGYVEFSLINPPETRNMIGNFLTIGNSVECITNKKGLPIDFNAYSGSCQNDVSLSNNDYVVKYIDVDDNSGTWNSSSANFELPGSYLELDEGKGIAWAGIFWQGSVNNRGGFQQRRAYSVTPTRYDYKVITNSEPINLASSGANKILIKVDNQDSYDEVTADTFYNDLAHGSYGGYYAAYANITSLLQSKNLSKGLHKITVANIVANEGRELDIGNYAGWSLVIIYKEDFNGKPRNISIYNGYQPIGKGGNTNIPSKEVKITGFKLPKAGEVEATIGAFVGEGEQKYGGTPIVYDKMYIRDINNNKIYNMPSTTPTNIFNATLENIQRDSGRDNDIVNTNGIDVDSYNVSNIMEEIRDNKIDTNTINIGIISKDEDLSNGDQSDYVTASMISFATELYAPKVCYDYDLKLNEVIEIPSVDRNFSVNSSISDTLKVKLMIKSQEADFDLIDTKLSNIFTPDTTFKYIPGKSKTTYPNTFSYYDAIETNSNIGEIAIGDNPTTEGGVLGAKVTTYSKLYYKFLKPYFDGKFDVVLNAKISFDGINKVPYKMSTQAPKDSVFYISRCDTNPVYNPVYGMFNIERGDSTFSQSPIERYSLYTQVAGEPYQISIASYKKDNNYTTSANKVDTTIELELIDGGTFDNNSSAGYDSVCEDPESYAKGVFVKFNNTSRVTLEIPKDYPTYPIDLASKNAIFRVWALTKKVGKDRLLINHDCKNQEDSSCFEALYEKIYKNEEDNATKFCIDKCSNSSGSSCYDCLREHFALPICSRDNFAIRPDSYSIAIKDANQTNSSNQRGVAINDTTPPKNIAAGYIYNLDINATLSPNSPFNNKRRNVRAYFFLGDNNSTRQSFAKFETLGNCEDKDSKILNVILQYGRTIPSEINTTTNIFKISNVGEYGIYIKDKEWTKVDQEGYPLKPFPNHKDCLENSNLKSTNGLNGCDIVVGSSATFDKLTLRLHPYKFDINATNIQANPNSSSPYIYVNDLNSTPLTEFQNRNVMALNINSKILAYGADNQLLSNFDNGCFANSINTTISYTPKDLDTTKYPINYALYEPSVDSSSTPNIISSLTNKVNYLLKPNYFQEGEGVYNGYLNVKREFNNPINPFAVTIKELNVSYTKSLNANMLSNYIPKTTNELNTTKNFYYGRVKSKIDFYDDVYSDSIETPIEVTIYCNKSIDYCKNYDINISKGLTNEYDWWLSTNHNGAKDGKAILEANSTKVKLEPSNTFDDFKNGIDEKAKVTKKSGVSLEYPYLVEIKPKQDMIDNYSYLLFNKGANIPPAYLYKVRFVNTSGSWSGKGKSGYTIDYNTTGRRTKKVDW